MTVAINNCDELSLDRIIAEDGVWSGIAADRIARGVPPSGLGGGAGRTVFAILIQEMRCTQLEIFYF